MTLKNRSGLLIPSNPTFKKGGAVVPPPSGICSFLALIALFVRQNYNSQESLQPRPLGLGLRRLADAEIEGASRW